MTTTPSPDREKLIADGEALAEKMLLFADAVDDARIVQDLVTSLAAPVEVDREKLAEVTDSHKMTIYGAHNFAGCAGCGERYVDTGIGIVRWFSKHRSQAVAEWLGGVEL